MLNRKFCNRFCACSDGPLSSSGTITRCLPVIGSMDNELMIYFIPPMGITREVQQNMSILRLNGRRATTKVSWCARPSLCRFANLPRKITKTICMKESTVGELQRTLTLANYNGLGLEGQGNTAIKFTIIVWQLKIESTKGHKHSKPTKESWAARCWQHIY